jgi:hypothetical protein
MTGSEELTALELLTAMNNINRLEVIDQTGRAYVHYLDELESVRYSLQDGNRTLKIFIAAAATDVPLTVRPAVRIDKPGKQEIQKGEDE